MNGEEVIAIEVLAYEKDELGNEVPADTKETPIGNVLVAPGSAAVTGGDNRPEGTFERYTLYLPKGSTTSALEYAVRGVKCRVVGEPAIWPDSPTEWSAVVEVEVTHG